MSLIDPCIYIFKKNQRLIIWYDINTEFVNKNKIKRQKPTWKLSVDWERPEIAVEAIEEVKAWTPLPEEFWKATKDCAPAIPELVGLSAQAIQFDDVVPVTLKAILALFVAESYVQCK